MVHDDTVPLCLPVPLCPFRLLTVDGFPKHLFNKTGQKHEDCPKKGNLYPWITKKTYSRWWFQICFYVQCLIWGRFPILTIMLFWKGLVQPPSRLNHVAARVHLRPMILVEGCHPLYIAMISGPEKVESCYFDWTISIHFLVWMKICSQLNPKVFQSKKCL